jgi:hypothetical protein
LVLGEIALNVPAIPIGIRTGMLAVSSLLSGWGALETIIGLGPEPESGHDQPIQSSTRTLIVSVVPTTPGR